MKNLKSLNFVEILSVQEDQMAKMNQIDITVDSLKLEVKSKIENLKSFCKEDISSFKEDQVKKTEQLKLSRDYFKSEYQKEACLLKDQIDAKVQQLEASANYLELDSKESAKEV